MAPAALWNQQDMGSPQSTRKVPGKHHKQVAFASCTHRRLGAGWGGRKSWRVAGKEPLEEDGKGSGVMTLAGEPGQVKKVVDLCGGEVGVRRQMGARTSDPKP